MVLAVVRLDNGVLRVLVLSLLIMVVLFKKISPKVVLEDPSV
jgi:hypothetical protein